MSEATRLEELRHALKEARDRMHRYAGRAFNLGLLDEREVREYRRLLKRGRIQTLPRSESPLQALVNEYEAVGDRYRALVEEAQVEPEVPRESVAPKREGAETRIQEIESWDEERMKDFVERHKVVQYMEQGFSSKEAVKRAGVSRSSSWARKWYARYGESGIAGLVDLRCFNGADPSVLTHEHRRLILGARKARPAATVKSVFERVEKVCAVRDITPPSYESVKKFLSHLCPAIRAALTENWDEMKKQHLPMKSVLRSKRPNERWQSR
jgi:transposase